MCQRPTEVLGLVAGQGNDLGDDFAGELHRCARAVLIREHLDDEPLKLGGIVLSSLELSLGLDPAAAPAFDGLETEAETSSNLGIVESFAGTEDDLGASDEILWGGVPLFDAVQLGVLWS
jgi:hypothetical protein